MIHTISNVISSYAWRPVGLMDKASASGAGDSRFESWADQLGLGACASNARPAPTSAAEWFYPPASKTWPAGFDPPAGPGLGLWLLLSPNKVVARTAGCKRPGQADCNDSRPCARPPLHTWAAAASCPQVRGQFVFVHSADVLLGFHFIRRSVGLMDKASASGAGDSRFESWAG